VRGGRMNKIKFRAWDKIDKEMISADVFYFGDISQPFIESVKDVRERFVIMQYTGLKDKNGVEIYECDIVTVQSRGLDFTVVVEEITAYGFETKIIHGLDYEQMFYSPDWENSEVIGNKYENPELLENKNEQINKTV
jgi:uncharacterized phage protein (TIGR01671 family)